MGGQLPTEGALNAGNGTIIDARTALDDLVVFALVATHASFRAASQRARIPTSSVSRAVARLEKELGIRLLQRTTRKVTVTEDGRQLLLRAAPHLEGLGDALTAAASGSDEPSGLIRVTAPAYTGATRLTVALAAFALAYPKVKVEIDPSHYPRSLIDDGYDFAVQVGPVEATEFVARPLWKVRAGLFATPKFARSVLGRRTVVTRADLERGPCVAARSSETWVFADTAGSPVLVRPGIRFAVSDPRATVEVARQGVGFVLAPVDAVAAAPAGLLAMKTDFGEPRALDLFVVYPTRRLLPRRVRLAIDWIAKTL
jgi:LysR family transcriptional regulator AphB